MRSFNSLDECLKDVSTVAISGHVRPDGDCVGSCMAVYNYILENYPEIKAEVYLEKIPGALEFLQGTSEVLHSCEGDKKFDLFIALDCGETGRLGFSSKYFETAGKTICIDHHISSSGMADENVIEPGYSATCEVLYELLDNECISSTVAEALYTGIIHDCGVFQYTNTSPRTMRIGAALIEKGIPFTKIVEESFYQKTYHQNRILGNTLLKSELACDGKVIWAVVDKAEMEHFQVTSADLDGIVSQLRNTKGVEVAIFLYETGEKEYKASMRSNGSVNVSRIAVSFGGGGHIKAAGCGMKGTSEEIIKSLVEQIKNQLTQE